MEYVSNTQNWKFEREGGAIEWHSHHKQYNNGSGEDVDKVPAKKEDSCNNRIVGCRQQYWQYTVNATGAS